MMDAEDGWREDDEMVFETYVKPYAGEKPVILVINKVDRIGPLENLLPFVEEISKKHPEFKEIVPISAQMGFNIDRLLTVILNYLLEGEPLFPEEMITDLPFRLLVAEVIREKVLLKVHQEIPQGVAVVVNEITHNHRQGWTEAKVHRKDGKGRVRADNGKKGLFGALC
jgi:GTP-binding protein Era